MSRQNRKEQHSYKSSLKWILEVVVFTSIFIGGAVLMKNIGSGPIRTGKIFTLGNFGFLMLGVGGLRVLMLFFPNWTRKQSDTPSRKRKRLRGHWVDSYDE